MILVTGASGKTGRTVISSLVSRGCPVRALVHRENQVPSIKSLGAEVVVGDLCSQSSLTAAARGVEGVYHICPNVNPNELQIGRMAMSAAQDARVKLFVFHSVLHPQVEEMPHHWLKLRVEEEIFASSLPYVILQPAAYMQNVLAEWRSIIERGVYTVPYSVKAPMSLVDLEDVGQAAAVVLNEPKYVGGVYELAGPDVLTPDGISKILGNRVGRDVHAETIPIESWKERALSTGLGRYQTDALVKMFKYYDQHGLCGNPRILESLIGRAPTRFTDFVDRTVRSRSSSRPKEVTV